MSLRRFLSPSILMVLLLGSLPSLKATHNLAGQITAEQSEPDINPNKYTLTLTTYTDPAPAGVDRCSANIEIYSVQNGPNGPIYTLITIIEDIPRANGPLMTTLPSDCTLPPGVNPRNGVPVKGTIKENFYFTEFAFPGPGRYHLRYYDLARSEGIINLTKSQEQTFYVETLLFITPPIVGNNNSPVLLNRPLDDACIGKTWTHNPGGFDKDGDSLAYRLSPSLQYDPSSNIPPTPTNGYRFPDDPGFGVGNTFVMDPLTGLVTWEVPATLGVYNFAYIVEEWRDGVLLGYVLRDMAVTVIDCDNNPPIIETITDTCVQAGDELRFGVKSWDPDVVDSLYFQLNNGSLGANGPFALPDNPADISGLIINPFPGVNVPFTTLPVSTRNNGVGQPVDTVKGTVVWQTSCDNIRKSPFQVDFYATDNKNYASPNFPNNTTLSANKVVIIRVVPPPPTDLIAIKGASRSVNLTWSPTFCSDRVVGYKVYRKLDGGDYMQDTICCEMTPDQAGFTLIADVLGWANTSYDDSFEGIVDLAGKEICYVVTATYADQTNPDLPILESCATNTACVSIEIDNLFMTNDSVAVTNISTGEVFVSWSLPIVDEFFPAPYTYRLYRGNNNSFPAIAIATLPYQDTTYFDTNLDTESRGYNYRVEVFDGSGKRVPTRNNKNIGSTIYLITTGGNNAVTLSWSEYVPWTNTDYVIFRSVNGGPFDSLTTVTATAANTHSYVDLNLNPNSEYCYFIRSTGSHNRPDIKPILINDSQVSCSFARDEEPPCPPLVEATGDCDARIYTVTVTKSDPDCNGDTEFITVKFGQSEAGPFREVQRIEYPSFAADTTLTIIGLPEEDFAGCYIVTATDTLGNESTISLPSCIDYCPTFIMANVFSPNDDGINDVLRPVQYQDVILKQIQIFDRWGRKMYETNVSIDRLWDGTVAFSSKPAEPGVYYYYLLYEELGINGNTPRELKGWVTLMR
ncbi:MAG: gliding motility-associated C-terminal domain-containing protein [Bacteroidia bacterium]|nr:gliding motility-associated C-terminal domain-containing protein [Bacteroidia bacterium]